MAPQVHRRGFFRCEISGYGIECPQVEKQFPSREAAKIWIIENQFGRRNLSPYDRSVLALKLEPLYAEEAKRRMEEGRNQYSPSQNSDEGNRARTDEQLAKLAGTSRDTIRKVKVIEGESTNPHRTVTVHVAQMWHRCGTAT